MFIVRNTPAYVITYLVLMAPTYILPYFGSNSALFNAFGAALLGMGPTPQWWAHVWFLVMLAVLGWLRGNAVGKTFLPVFPVLAAAFDLTPGLSAVPMIPTLLHLGGIIVGVVGAVGVTAEVAATNAELLRMRKAKVIAGVATLLAVGGSTLFLATLSRPAKNLPPLSKPSEVKAPATAISPAQHQQNTTRPDTPAPKDAIPFATPSSASTEAGVRPQTSPKAAHATSITEPRKIRHRTAKVKNDPQAAEIKPENQKEQNVRYIRIND